LALLLVPEVVAAVAGELEVAHLLSLALTTSGLTESDA